MGPVDGAGGGVAPLWIDVIINNPDNNRQPGIFSADYLNRHLLPTTPFSYLNESVPRFINRIKDRWYRVDERTKRIADQNRVVKIISGKWTNRTNGLFMWKVFDPIENKTRNLRYLNSNRYSTSVIQPGVQPVVPPGVQPRVGTVEERLQAMAAQEAVLRQRVTTFCALSRA